ncbi:MAG: ANTAR domain-containing protein [Pseudomonadales bacterium]|nr:ANTAR domain-containing protein [Pseudomonadales bacterium]
MNSFNLASQTFPLKTESVQAVLLDTVHNHVGPLQTAILDCGYQLLSCVQSVDEVFAAVDQYQPNCLLIHVGYPDVDMLAMLAKLDQLSPLTVIMFSQEDSPQVIQQAVAAGVDAFIVDAAEASRLSAVTTIAMARFRDTQVLKQQLHSTQGKLEERKLLDKAKGLLMQQKGFSEDQAYKSLRKMSMDKGQPMVTVARNIIDVFALLD